MHLSSLEYESVRLSRHQIFGSDPEVFRPERWLEAGVEERIAEMEKVHSLIFNHGGTKCLGIGVAYLTLNEFSVEVSTTSLVHGLGPNLST